MTISPRSVATSAADLAVALAAGAWVQLGVSGWTPTHSSWAIDPDPLVIFTAWLADRDPRLRDEVTDWCIRHSNYLSQARMKTLVRRQPDDVRDAYGEFAATIAHHTRRSWPGATSPRMYVPTGRSRLAPLTSPAMSWIRLRAIFGVGARTEVLRVFLSGVEQRATLAALAQATGYTKRNVADECAALAAAGVLAARRQGNRFEYALARTPELVALIGGLAPYQPDWVALLNVVRTLVSLAERAVGASAAFPVHVNNALVAIADDLDAMRLGEELRGVDVAERWDRFRDVAFEALRRWANGEDPYPG